MDQETKYVRTCAFAERKVVVSMLLAGCLLADWHRVRIRLRRSLPFMYETTNDRFAKTVWALPARSPTSNGGYVSRLVTRLVWACSCG